MTKISKEFLDLTEGGGEMGKLIQAVDWNQSPVGPFEKWPQSLKTALSICLGSKFPMFVWWGKDLTVFYNDAYIPFTGLKHPTYLGRPAREQWAEIWEALQPLTQQVIETGRATWAESMLLFMTRKGFLEETYFTFSYSPIRDESGAVAGIINPCQETTDLVLSERRLKILHEMGSHETKSIQEVAEAATQAIIGNPQDIPFSLIYLSNKDGSEATLISSSGIKRNASTTPLTLELSPQSRDLWNIHRIHHSHQPERIDNLRSLIPDELPTSPYEEKPDSAYVIPLLLPNRENPAGFLVLGISPRLEFDERYREFFGLICQYIGTHISNVQALEEEKMRAKALMEIDQAKTAFFSNVSHEFRTPLTLILGPMNDLINGLHGSLTENQKEQLEVLNRNALRLLGLVNSLLDFSRIEAGRVQAVYEPLDLAELTAALASAFHSAVERVGMKLVVDCPPLSSPVYVDKDMWEKIVLNLLSNAFKYTFEGEIEITLRPVGTNVELKVRDTGTGIPEQELPKIFERFHRVDGARGRTHEGTGIGLALVQELVKLHGGNIGVKSVFGQGTTFTVTLPIGSAHLPQDRITHTRSEATVRAPLPWIQGESDLNKTSPAPVALKSSKKRIVLADDNADMREYIRKLLASDYEVLAVTNGKEALNTARAQLPDLIVSDIMMPVMDGIEFLRLLREDTTLKTTPVILLSARAGDESKTSGIEHGADDYVTKPFSAKELLARVQTQLNLAEMRTQLLRELEFSNQELEAFSRSVSHDLRAPLRSMSGFSQALLEDHAQSLNPEMKDYLHRVSSAADKMRQIIDGLLKLSRLTRGEFNKQNVNLSKIAQKIATDLSSAGSSHPVQFSISPELNVKGDPQLIEIALQNLLSNAWKFTSKTARPNVQFGSMEKNQEKIYFVRDNGAGFDMKYSDKLFGVFQRLHADNDFEGTGIGLATVRRIIQRHNGRIWAEAKPNEGATFYFTL